MTTLTAGAETSSGRQLSARSGNTPDRSVPLVGHRQLLAAVRRTLATGRRALLCPAGGRVGTGATTAMVEFAHRHADDYDLAWWIRATDPELVPDEMAGLAEALGVAGAEDDAEAAAARALQVLRRRDRYLLVFDDAATPHQLARFLPTGSGHVVIISPDPSWRVHATAHTVEPFTRAESVALLCSRRPDLAVAEAERVAAVLEDLPTAVDPAAGLLARSGMSSEGFLGLVSHRDHGGAWDPVEATWRTVFDHLDVDDPVGLAVLTLVAWIGPDPVPAHLLVDHPDLLPAPLAGVARNRAVLAAHITDLGQHGLISVTSAGLRLGRRPAALLRARTAHVRNDRGDLADSAVRLLRAAVPDAPGAPDARGRWRSLLPLVLAVTDPARRLGASVTDAAWLLRGASAYLDMRGQRDTAGMLARDADDLDGLRRSAVPGAVAVRPGSQGYEVGQR